MATSLAGLPPLLNSLSNKQGFLSGYWAARPIRSTLVHFCSTEQSSHVACKAYQRTETSFPVTLEQSIDQAKFACKYAIRDGLTQLQLELLLPLIGATDLDDWPGGIQQQFKAAIPVVSSLLSGLIEEENFRNNDSFHKYFLDEGDATGVWENEKVALVLFPTAESLVAIENLATAKDRPLILLNPQWQDGQIISDFGFGTQRKKWENFIQCFSNVYYLKKIRMFGEDVCVLKCYPRPWEVFVVQKDGNVECIAAEEEKPSYNRLQELLKQEKRSIANKGWFGRILEELRLK
eukprot:TRINITY_DN13409_c0_g1_i2.p1 TRINITY_DN13409_c0_g1~~TRINITY_DN13409_c0_g1_i2.p1  ORF type:complete len:292 (+),score=58.76 TRINITY_DN13409_c0_g1_i2:55-930(+)